MTAPRIPPRIQRLERDRRGRIRPWFAAANVPAEFQRITALKNNLCWTCGDALGQIRTFVMSPAYAIIGTAWEPPSHLDCARWAMATFQRLEPELANSVSVLWTCQAYEVFGGDEKHPPVIAIGEPIKTEFWTKRRRATRAEIDANLRVGMAALEPLLSDDPDPISAFEALGRRQRAFEALLPGS